MKNIDITEHIDFDEIQYDYPYIDIPFYRGPLPSNPYEHTYFIDNYYFKLIDVSIIMVITRLKLEMIL